MLELLKKFENKRPEIVFEWKDSETDAEGWFQLTATVLDSHQLRYWLLSQGDSLEVVAPKPMRDWFGEISGNLSCASFGVSVCSSKSKLRAVVASFCPNMLLPYARQTVSDLITKGGFPPFFVPPVNFDALLEQAIAQQQAQDGATNDGSAALN